MLAICSTCGFDSFRCLLKFDASAAGMVRVSFTEASFWTYLRHVHTFLAYPWRLAPLGGGPGAQDNRRVPEEARQRIEREFLDACPNCLDSGFARPLKGKVQELRDEGFVSDSHLPNLVVTTVSLWTDLHDQHTFDIECIHGHNKNRAAQQNQFMTIAARCVNSMIMATRSEALEDQDQIWEPEPLAITGGGSAGDAEELVVGNASRQRSFKSPLCLFHNKCSKRDKALGVKHNPCSRAYWASVREEFSQLSAEDMAKLEDYTTTNNT